ncbi:ferritin-like domain-containing protein [Dongia deserti]|uniref:ferritin-like domain-containing protein n=1 Tax=Dongia deserti TaxID=2268030 RepID=UPI0013C45912|nr:ferritin-like domain-containing protein [Dongia deserti]
MWLALEENLASADERFMEWLRDAHAMEEQSEQMLERTCDRLENYPEVRERFNAHRAVSRRHADTVRQCIGRRGGSPSAIKDTAGKLMAFAQGASGLFVGDEVVKAILATSTFEQMKISSYEILKATARTVGDSETERACEENLREEQQMADWLEDNIAPITQTYLQREEASGVTAKH